MDHADISNLRVKTKARAFAKKVERLRRKQAASPGLLYGPGETKVFRPRIAFVGTQIDEFSGDKYKPYEKSLVQLKVLAESMGFELLAEAGPVKSLEQAEKLMASLRHRYVDFILVQ